MNPNLLKPEVQNYIRAQENQDLRNVSLKKSPFENLSSSEIAQQIKGLQIARNKFPFFYQTQGIYYPSSLNLEQASSWITARYKSEILNGKTLIDLTAGMGIDAFGFAQKFEKVTALERNSELAEISKHNYKALNQNNLEYINSDFEIFWKENPEEKWDVIYLDPSRRINSQRKFVLEDLEPNILEWMDTFLSRSENLMIKLSPLLDLKSTVEKIPQIQEIHIVAVKNEVKELLLICKNEIQTNPKIIAANLESGHPLFEFHLKEEETAVSEFSSPEKFIYEPNSAVLKSGAFKLLGEDLDLKKLHIHSHLYTSKEFFKPFPGKVFEILEEIKNPKNKIEKSAFHIISKNYPLSVELIRKKYKIKESEDQTLIFTQSQSGKHILKCRRVL